MQLAPTATTLPLTQGITCFVAWIAFSAKSPLMVIVLMFSVAVPVLVRVTFFAELVVPTAKAFHFSEVGVRVTIGPPPLLGFTVRLTVVVAVKLPDVPVIVTVDVPVAAVALAVSVSVLVVLVGFGLNPAVTPLGKPEAARVTLPLNPSCGLTVIVLVPLAPPCWMVTLVGEADSVKDGPAGVVRALIRPDPFGLPHPVAKS